MPQVRTLTLVEPFSIGTKQITEFKFREPRFNDYFELGDPRLPVQREKTVIWQILPDVVRQYAERLLLPEYDPNHLNQIRLRDSLRCETEILGFFRDAEAPMTSAAKLENSSSS